MKSRTQPLSTETSEEKTTNRCKVTRKSTELKYLTLRIYIYICFTTVDIFNRLVELNELKVADKIKVSCFFYFPVVAAEGACAWTWQQRALCS